MNPPRPGGRRPASENATLSVSASTCPANTVILVVGFVALAVSFAGLPPCGRKFLIASELVKVSLKQLLSPITTPVGNTVAKLFFRNLPLLLPFGGAPHPPWVTVRSGGPTGSSV